MLSSNGQERGPENHHGYLEQSCDGRPIAEQNDLSTLLIIRLVNGIYEVRELGRVASGVPRHTRAVTIDG